MSIAQQINRIKTNIAAAYDGLNERNAQMPVTQNSNSLKSTIDSLPHLSDKMDKLQYPTAVEEIQNMPNGQLFQYNGEIGITNDTAEDNYTMMAKKDDLTALATKAQLASISQSTSPCFVSDISECTDTSKFYVLPDGYIYAYQRIKKLIPTFTNLIPSSTVSGGGAIYNRTGFKDGAYVSGITDGTDADYTATGYIPYPVPVVGLPDSIYVKGALWDTANHTRFSLYADDYSYLNTISGSGSGGLRGYFTTEQLGNNYFRFIPVASGSGSALSGTGLNISLARFSFPCNGSDLIISTTPIEYTPVYEMGWTNTGLAFTPADYEDRILLLEANAASVVARINALENNSSHEDPDAVPSFVIAEADRAAKAVLSHQNADTISFFTISDAHYTSDSYNIKNAVAHAGMGMEQIRKSAQIDFGVVLGDNGWQGPLDSLEDGIEQIRATNRLISEGLRGIPNFRTPGNHCSQIGSYYTNNDYHRNGDLFPLYGAYNTGAVFDGDNRRRGYCYRDFDDRKLRVIVLNTSDLEEQIPADLTTVNISTEQMEWLVSALDVSEKTTPSEWQILLLSHAPLDWNERTIPAAAILSAYRQGTSGGVSKDGKTIPFDYSNTERGSIIALIHGHIHDFKVDDLRYLDASGSKTLSTGIKRISLPNACYSRNNEYNNGEYEYLNIDYGEETTYKKVAETARDTSFCVVTIDLQKRIVYADCYGSGYDRIVRY